MNDWERMVGGKLYNSSDEEVAKRHIEGMSRCRKYNKIDVRERKLRLAHLKS